MINALSVLFDLLFDEVFSILYDESNLRLDQHVLLLEKLLIFYDLSDLKSPGCFVVKNVFDIVWYIWIEFGSGRFGVRNIFHIGWWIRIQIKQKKIIFFVSNWLNKRVEPFFDLEEHFPFDLYFEVFNFDLWLTNHMSMYSFFLV